MTHSPSSEGTLSAPSSPPFAASRSGSTVTGLTGTSQQGSLPAPQVGLGSTQTTTTASSPAWASPLSNPTGFSSSSIPHTEQGGASSNSGNDIPLEPPFARFPPLAMNDHPVRGTVQMPSSSQWNIHSDRHFDHDDKEEERFTNENDYVPSGRRGSSTSIPGSGGLSRPNNSPPFAVAARSSSNSPNDDQLNEPQWSAPPPTTITTTTTGSDSNDDYLANSTQGTSPGGVEGSPVVDVGPGTPGTPLSRIDQWECTFRPWLGIISHSPVSRAETIQRITTLVHRALTEASKSSAPPHDLGSIPDPPPSNSNNEPGTADVSSTTTVAASVPAAAAAATALVAGEDRGASSSSSPNISAPATTTSSSSSSPTPTGQVALPINPDSISSSMISLETSTAALDFLNFHLPYLVRFARESPFDDVATPLRSLLVAVRSTLSTILIPPERCSTYVAGLPSVTPPSAPVTPLFKEIFVSTARLTHYERLLGHHPEYLRTLFNAHHKTLREEGPLPAPMRNYIAILAAARHQCTYLIQLQEDQFRVAGGDPLWLQGVEFAPAKIQALLELNALLAHRPWALTREHIAALAQGQSGSAWSMGELVHAIVIMVTYHALCGVVLGLGTELEPDHWMHAISVDPSSVPPIPDGTEKAADSEGAEGLNEAVISELLADAPEEDDDAPLVSAIPSAEADVSEPAIRYIWGDEEVQQLENSAIVGRGGASQSTHLYPHYVDKWDVPQVDFDIHKQEDRIRTFRMSTYSWAEEGYSLMAELLPFMAEPLDVEFRTCETMTDGRFFTQELDTSRFRRAVAVYVNRVYGMVHDDYNYGDMNKLLRLELKIYLKKVAVTPENVTQDEWNKFGLTLRPEEKIHINVLANNARKKGALLYGMHAISKFFFPD